MQGSRGQGVKGSRDTKTRIRVKCFKLQKFKCLLEPQLALLA
jgi:hypothetical protein